MRAAAHEVRRAHHRRDAARVRRFGRRVRRRKLGARDALPRRLLDVLTPEERATLAVALPKIGRESECIAIVGWQRLLDGA